MVTAPAAPAQTIREAVTAAVDNLKGIDVGAWLYDVMRDVFDVHPCDSEHCPAQPQWDKARGAMFEKLAPQMDDGLAAWLVDTITPAFERYAEAHPDAPRKVVTR